MRIFEYRYTGKISKGEEGMKEIIIKAMGRSFSILSAGAASGAQKPSLLDSTSLAECLK